MNQMRTSEPLLRGICLMSMCAGVAFGVEASYAVPIKFEFSGRVIDVSEHNNSFGGLNVNDPFVARFSFDTESPDLLPADPVKGRYIALSSSFEIPRLTIEQCGGVLETSDDLAIDRLTFDSTGAVFQIRAVFSGDPSAMSSDAMPTEVFPAMDGVTVLNVFSVTSSDKFSGTITSAVIIPEPAALAFVLAGLIFGMPLRRC